MTKSNTIMPYRTEGPGFRFVACTVWATLFVFVLSYSAGAAQPPAPPAAKSATKPPAKAPPAKAKAADAKEGEEEGPPKPPEPERVKLETKDGWKIHATYYGPMEGKWEGKQTVPIIMIHGWEGQGSEYSFLALGLQRLGLASIVPDLRGHGRSTTRRLPDGDFETVRFDDSRKFTTPVKEAMVLDIEAAKSFLLQKNNAGEVNIEMLCVIGADLGSIVALNWAAMDWNAPRTPYLKQGQYVKALVLLSPRQALERLNAANALNHPAITRQVSILVAVGENSRKEYSDAKKIHNRIEKLRPAPPKDPREALRKKDLFLIEADTNLQGTKLLDRRLPVVYGSIARFIELRLLFKREEFQWAERKSPLAGR